MKRFCEFVRVHSIKIIDLKKKISMEWVIFHGIKFLHLNVMIDFHPTARLKFC